MMQQSQNSTLPQVSWRTIPIGDEFMSMFTSIKQSSYRLETLQSYGESSESSPFHDYSRGVTPDPSFMDEWCQILKANVNAGHSMRRVHIVDLPLTQYMRFEIECCYQLSDVAGEEIRLLDRSIIPPGLLKSINEDYWLFDRSTIMVNDYDVSGALYQARITTDPKAVAFYAHIEEKTWELSVPFRQFYKTHTGLEV